MLTMLDIILLTPTSCMHAKLLQLSLTETLWTVAHQAPLFMGLSRQEYWSVLPCPPPGDLPHQGFESMSLNISCLGKWALYKLAPPALRFWSLLSCFLSFGSRSGRAGSKWWGVSFKVCPESNQFSPLPLPSPPPPLSPCSPQPTCPT